MTTTETEPVVDRLIFEIDDREAYVLRMGEDDASAKVPAAPFPVTLTATSEFDRCVCLRAGEPVIVMYCHGHEGEKVRVTP